MTGILYLVPTPIGNLEDITLRALRILKEVDTIVCEDTRQTVKLLNHYDIRKPLVSFYTYNQAQRLPHLIADLRNGKDLAIVSDSGTPGISDPGSVLVRAAIKEGIPVIPLPGANAVLTALIASGLPTDGFVFLGFLKRKPGKMKKELAAAAGAGATIIFYESPHRIKKTLELCGRVFPRETPTVVARELTKKFEEFVRGTLSGVTEQIAAREILGELVVLISPATGKEEVDDHEDEHE